MYQRIQRNAQILTSVEAFVVFWSVITGILQYIIRDPSTVHKCSQLNSDGWP